MSRGFVKEDDLELAGTNLPERATSGFPNYVTPLGLAQLQHQATQLEKTRLTLIANKDDPTVQQKLASIERDLRYVESRLKSAIVSSPDKTAQQILFGATVDVEDSEGKPYRFIIVGEDEADIHANKVSWSSPIAKALIGHKVDEEVTWLRPSGNTVLIITAIEY